MADKGRTLERLPARVGGDGTLVVFVGFKPAQDAAACMAEAGLAYESPRAYAKVDSAFAQRVAGAFEAMAHDPQDPEVKACL